MSKVLVPLADGFEDLEAVAAVDVLRRGGVEVVTAAVGEGRSVRSAHGVRLEADALLDDVIDDGYDAIVLPGGAEGTANLKACEPLLDRLNRQREERALICAICAAPLVLVEAGVLDPEVQVTCYPTCQMELDREWSPAPVVADGNVITSQAPGTALMFALVVLRHLAGDAVAGRVARGMVAEMPMTDDESLP